MTHQGPSLSTCASHRERNLLVLLQSLIRLTVLAQPITTLVSGTLVVADGLAAGGATLLAALLSCFDWVDLAVSEGVLLHALVGLAVLAETVVLCR